MCDARILIQGGRIMAEGAETERPSAGVLSSMRLSGLGGKNEIQMGPSLTALGLRRTQGRREDERE
jgi:hypothetical protein